MWVDLTLHRVCLLILKRTFELYHETHRIVQTLDVESVFVKSGGWKSLNILLGPPTKSSIEEELNLELKS